MSKLRTAKIIPRTVSFAYDFDRSVNGREIRQEKQIFIGRRRNTAAHIFMIKVLGKKIFNGNGIALRIGKGNISLARE